MHKEGLPASLILRAAPVEPPSQGLGQPPGIVHPLALTSLTCALPRQPVASEGVWNSRRRRSSFVAGEGERQQQNRV